MKIHKGTVNARVYAQVARHYAHSVRQSASASATTPAIGAYRHDGEPRTLHAYAPNASLGRKSKMLKSGIRRVTYK